MIKFTALEKVSIAIKNLEEKGYIEYFFGDDNDCVNTIHGLFGTAETIGYAIRQVKLDVATIENIEWAIQSRIEELAIKNGWLEKDWFHESLMELF